MIKAIIFDIGNVIIGFDNDIFLNELSKHTEKLVDELRRIIYHESDAFLKYERGEISSEEFYETVKEITESEISIDEFSRIYTGIFKPIESTVNLIPNLKKNYKLGLLSNTSIWDYELGVSKLFDTTLFDSITLSYEVGAMKPDEIIFVDAIEKLGLEPEECVFIDDIKNYSETAKDLGIHGINYVSHEKLLEELRELGVDVE